MTSIVTPVFTLAAPAQHQTNHCVQDGITGFPSTEISNSDSFTSSSVIRVKELRADRNSGAVKATKIIVSNRNGREDGSYTEDSLYTGQSNIITFNSTTETAAFQVMSGGAVIRDGLKITGSNIVNGNIITSGTISTSTIDNVDSTGILLRHNGSNIASTFMTTGFGSNDYCGLSLSGTRSYLALPNHPRFTARVNTGGYGPAYMTGLANTLNHGSCLNLTTGVFTAPVTGHYQFTLTGISAATATSITIALRVNDITGNIYAYSGSVTGYSARPVGFTTNLLVNANDTVRIYYADANSGLSSLGSYWSGHLISVVP